MEGWDDDIHLDGTAENCGEWHKNVSHVPRIRQDSYLRGMPRSERLLGVDASSTVNRLGDGL